MPILQTYYAVTSLYWLYRASGAPLHLIKRLLGPKSPSESKLSRVLRGIDKLDPELESSLRKVFSLIEAQRNSQQ